MKIEYVCPSKGRAEKVLTKKLIPGLVLVVPWNEVDEYKEHNPNNDVIGTPSDIRGITPTRQFILDKFESVFQIDDDVTACKKNYVTSEDEPNVIEPDDIMAIITETAYIAKETGAYLFGFSKIRNPLEYNSFKPIVHTGYVNASHFGVLKGHGLSYDLELTEGEDHYMSCLSIYRHRYVVIDNRFSFVTKGNFTALGGCNSYRNTESMIRNTIRLRELFGEVIHYKVPTKIKAKVNHGERSLSFPY